MDTDKDEVVMVTELRRQVEALEARLARLAADRRRQWENARRYGLLYMAVGSSLACLALIIITVPYGTTPWWFYAEIWVPIASLVLVLSYFDRIKPSDS